MSKRGLLGKLGKKEVLNIERREQDTPVSGLDTQRGEAVVGVCLRRKEENNIVEEE